MDFLTRIPLNFFIFLSLYFEVFLMITYFEKRKLIGAEEGREAKEAYPGVSIIIPAHNEEKTLAGTIHSLLNLEYPKEKLHILIIDDGSTDNTLSVAKTFETERNVRVFHKEQGGKHTALNFGLERVATELVGCLDADSYVQKDALKKIAAYFEDKTTMAVTPSIRVHNPKNILERIQNIEYNYGCFVRKIMSQMDALYVTPGPFSIFRKEVFTKLGNYRSAHNTEDIEIALRMQSNKFKIVNCHKAFVDTVTPKTFKTLYKQRLRWTYGFIKNAVDYKFMFFKKEYGNLGLLALPLAPIYILSALYIIFTLFYNLSLRALEQFTRIRITGFSHTIPQMHFNWYFINTDAKTFLTFVSFFLLCTIIVLGHRISGKKIKILDFFYTFVLYGIISPIWLTASIWKATTGKRTLWR